MCVICLVCVEWVSILCLGVLVAMYFVCFICVVCCMFLLCAGCECFVITVWVMSGVCMVYIFELCHVGFVWDL